VFLAEAIDAGLDMAIVDAARILPLYRIDQDGKETAHRLIHDERRWS
jgi:5-methyltetrahydrofolate--homocysteine methyltransferase